MEVPKCQSRDDNQNLIMAWRKEIIGILARIFVTQKSLNRFHQIFSFRSGSVVLLDTRKRQINPFKWFPDILISLSFRSGSVVLLDTRKRLRSSSSLRTTRTRSSMFISPWWKSLLSIQMLSLKRKDWKLFLLSVTMLRVPPSKVSYHSFLSDPSNYFCIAYSVA